MISYIIVSASVRTKIFVGMLKEKNGIIKSQENEWWERERKKRVGETNAKHL